MEIKAVLIATAILSTQTANAQNVESALPDGMVQAFNNFSAEMQTCQVYNLAALRCFQEMDPKSAATVQKTADAFAELAINSAKIVGLSEKALFARGNLLVQGMKDDLDGNCINISVLLNKYAKKCKAAMETSSARIEEILSGKY